MAAVMDNSGHNRWRIIRITAVLIICCFPIHASQPTLLAAVGVQAAAVPTKEGGGETAQSIGKTDAGICALTEALTPVSSILWPLLGLLIVMLVGFNSRVGRLFGLLPKFVHKIKGPAGIEIEINAEAAKEVRANFRASYKEFVALAKDEYERMADARSVRELLRNVVQTALPEVLREKGIEYKQESVRATIHVDDIVFRSYFCQLIDYFPGQSRGGAGRRFSHRYGIIGQSWRLEELLGRGEAVAAHADKETAIRDLVRSWGMTEEEAAHAAYERPATLSVLLRHDGQMHGVLYIDSKHENAFGFDVTTRETQPKGHARPDANEVARALEGYSATVRLARAVAEVREPLRLAAPFLEVGQ